MARILLVFIITLAGFVAVLGTECNKPNEVNRCVPKCPPQKTCKNKDIQVACLQRATEDCQDACVCKEGYFRSAGGECVTEDDCNKCGGQNEYYSCRVKPDNTCALLNQTSVDDDQDCDNASDSTQCKAQCYCSPGTARDENNVCVPYDQCNKPCDLGETKDYCPVDCPTDYCPKNEQNSVSCPRPKVCPPPQCKCRFNSRRAENGTCIPTRDCPPFKCKKHLEQYNPCPPLCPNGYCTQATPTGRCPAIFGRIGIVLECKPKCRCKPGYFWNEDKICIPYNQCPGKGNSTTTTTPAPDVLTCKSNEVKRCVKKCPPQKTCRTRNVEVYCLQDDTEACVDTCVCKDGYYKNPAGECVSEEVCDICTAQNQYYSCRTQPDETCATLNQTSYASANSTCKAQCYCDPGTARDENNVCVPLDQCNQPCGPDETKDYCPTNCPSDNCPKEEQTVSCPQPKPCPTPQCKCRFNYRRAENGTCIPTDQCPPFACKKLNEVYDPCPPLCPNGSCDQATPDGSCPPIFGQILIVLECSPQCRCKEGYWWNDDKICVSYDQCHKNSTLCTVVDKEGITNESTLKPEAEG